MKNGRTQWTKTELEIYILLLCANADKVEREAEIDLIKSKVDQDVFDKVYRDFSEETQENCLEKIRENIANHQYSHRELERLRKEMNAIFFADEKYRPMEQNLEKILNNMLY
ncbi:hypothetical protein SAMN04488034_1093 [Salinimicrobium catena]|uniref:TerB family tellurite resistance protein n=1 Tax=Salinimicrobium catena TaxID=390640 RepID=A0A1H5P749_9FLAO|nr:hypothetical protein [Salinimicrobium catena]SDL72560.1 hypothetical protein SAMN04488140_10979 [Salinimicrobium catena]SEF08871.1 hypothetical protein SAMN04488034_1093 [Salinimicrobium catena]